MLVHHRKDGATSEDASLIQAELEMDKNLLKVLQTACKAEKLQQALDIANLLTHPQSVDAAAKLAGFFHLTGLQERIHSIKEAKMYQRESQWDNRRKSKWAHLVDDRTVVDSGLERASRRNAGGSLFSTPFEDTLVPRSSLVATRQSVAPSQPATEERPHGRRETFPSRDIRSDDLPEHDTIIFEQDVAAADDRLPPSSDLSTPFEDRVPPSRRWSFLGSGG
jgi:chromosome transmission fidelity protein 4